MIRPVHPHLQAVLAGFGLPTALPVTVVAGGHINLSYRLGHDGRPLLLQRISPEVFRDGHVVLQNTLNVTAHLERHVRQERWPSPERRVAKQRLAVSGAAGVQAPDGAWWRLAGWIEDTRDVAPVTTPEEAREVGEAFGRFLRWMSDYDGPQLVPALAGFHDTQASLFAFENAVERDSAGRAAVAAEEVAAVRAARALATALPRGELPRRIIHADAKPANVLIDAASGEALGVIDLDTVMPGTLLFDFGDLIRSASCAVAEDEPAPGPRVLREDLFEGLLNGLAASLAPMPLHPVERRLIVTAGRVITHEQAARFLTDYLEGDRYFHTTRPGQNLDRTRVQLQLLSDLGKAEARLQQIVEQGFPAGGSPG